MFLLTGYWRCGLENCLLPGKPIGLPITLEWIGPAQTGRAGGAGTGTPESSSLYPAVFPLISLHHHILP